MVAPGLAFDRGANRLGYGGGHYDRLLGAPAAGRPGHRDRIPGAARRRRAPRQIRPAARRHRHRSRGGDRPSGPGPIMGWMIESGPPLRRTMTGVRVRALRDGAPVVRPDRLATEEPMEIRVAARARSRARRGHDAHARPRLRARRRVPVHRGPDPRRDEIDDGQLLRAPRRRAAVQRGHGPARPPVRRGSAPAELLRDVQLRRLRQGVARRGRACSCAPLGPGPTSARSTILGAAGALRAAQRVFDQTGGLHAAGLFDAGRDAAVAARGRRPAQRRGQARRRGAAGRRACRCRDRVLLVSGRAGFEIVQKAPWRASRSWPRCRRRRAWPCRRPRSSV